MKLSPPFVRAVVDVPDELVERYVAGGWSRIQSPAAERKPVQRKTQPRRRKSATKSEE